MNSENRNLKAMILSIKLIKEIKCTIHIYYLSYYDLVNGSTHLKPYIHKECREEIKGYWVKITPKIDYKILDTY